MTKSNQTTISAEQWLLVSGIFQGRAASLPPDSPERKELILAAKGALDLADTLLAQQGVTSGM